MTAIISGFLLGFLGSLHCIGMCGPIVLALPQNENKLLLVINRLLYNLGRVVTYSFMGLVLGLLGGQIKLAGLQEIASIATGVIIILVVLTPSKIKAALNGIKPVSRFNELIKKGFSRLFKMKSLTGLFLIGIINGFLPCGFVYVALAGAITQADLASSILFMAFFGVGTIPVMFVASIATSFIKIKSGFQVRKLIPVLAVILAIIFILRGLSLGIPYISPDLEKMQKKTTMMK